MPKITPTISSKLIRPDPNSGVTPPGSGPNCTTCSTDHVYKPVEVKYSKTTTAVAAKNGEEILYEITVEVNKSATTVDLVLQDKFEQGVKYSRLENHGKFNFRIKRTNY